MTFDPKAYDVATAVVHWLVVFGASLGVVLVIGLLASFGISGTRGPGQMGLHIGSGLADMASLSGRRVWALAVLTFKEAVRRKALMVFVVFAALFMFAGWFLTGASARADMQVKVYVSFVLTAISWLILPVALLLACWGLPEDIKARSLHTVVTKPARRNEVVLGRVVGFVLVCSLVLGVMAAVGYVWVDRQVTGAARPHLICRVPVYGTLTYLDRMGNPAEKGLNVGDIWEFRGYIEGATRARAIWEFSGIGDEHLITEPAAVDRPERRYLQLESRFEAFRTHKGKMGQQLLVEFELVNPQTGLRVTLPTFEVHDFGQNLTRVDEELVYTPKGEVETRTARLFGDVIQDGKLRVEVRCLDPGQYLGMARPDLFIRTPDRHFAVGYFKAIAGVWLKMALIVLLGVTASCFVKGPVATLLTFTLLIVGQEFRAFMAKIIGAQWKGGGPFESMIRIVTHKNPQIPLEEGLPTQIVQFCDRIIEHMLWLVQHIIPNFDHYQMAPYVANGFDVSWDAAVLPSIVVTLAYVLPCLLLGHFTLKLRELESK